MSARPLYVGTVSVGGAEVVKTRPGAFIPVRSQLHDELPLGSALKRTLECDNFVEYDLVCDGVRIGTATMELQQ